MQVITEPGRVSLYDILAWLWPSSARPPSCTEDCAGVDNIMAKCGVLWQARSWSRPDLPRSSKRDEFINGIYIRMLTSVRLGHSVQADCVYHCSHLTDYIMDAEEQKRRHCACGHPTSHQHPTSRESWRQAHEDENPESKYAQVMHTTMDI